MIGASVSEPHIDEFNVNFLYFYISIYISIFLYIYIYIVRRAVNHFLLVFCVFLRHALFPNWVHFLLVRWYRPTETRTMNSLPQQGLARMETIVGRWVAKAFHEDGESASVRPREVILLELTIPYNSPESLSNAKPCNCSEDGKLTALHTVTLNSLWPVMTDLASAENEEVILGGNNRDRDRSWTYLPDCFNAVKCMHECHNFWCDLCR